MYILYNMYISVDPWLGFENAPPGFKNVKTRRLKFGFKRVAFQALSEHMSCDRYDAVDASGRGGVSIHTTCTITRLNSSSLQFTAK